VSSCEDRQDAGCRRLVLHMADPCRSAGLIPPFADAAHTIDRKQPCLGDGARSRRCLLRPEPIRPVFDWTEPGAMQVGDSEALAFRDGRSIPSARVRRAARDIGRLHASAQKRDIERRRHARCPVAEGNPAAAREQESDRGAARVPRPDQRP